MRAQQPKIIDIPITIQIFRLICCKVFGSIPIKNLATTEFGNGRIPEHKHQLVSACVVSITWKTTQNAGFEILHLHQKV